MVWKNSLKVAECPIRRMPLQVPFKVSDALTDLDAHQVSWGPGSHGQSLVLNQPLQQLFPFSNRSNRTRKGPYFISFPSIRHRVALNYQVGTSDKSRAKTGTLNQDIMPWLSTEIPQYMAKLLGLFQLPGLPTLRVLRYLLMAFGG